MKSASNSDYDSFFDYDMGYHCYLVKLSGNSLFNKSIKSSARSFTFTCGILWRCMEATKAYPSSTRTAFWLLKARNTGKAAGIMVEHYDMLLERLTKWLAPG